MLFSERINKREPKSLIQIESMDTDLRVGLWNCYCLHFARVFESTDYIDESPVRGVIEYIWMHFLKEPLNRLPPRTDKFNTRVYDLYCNWDYLEIYDFVDWLANLDLINTDAFVNECNTVLERELSGYRFVSNQLVPITSKNEIEQIENAITNANTDGHNGVSIHLVEALNLLSNKTNPDYRNSIKESISALESACNHIAGKNDSLGKVLQYINIHSGLKSGLKSIYGFTSDNNGIRHGMMDDPNIDQEDAIFMLVMCSAFINFLNVKKTKSKK